MSTQLELRHSLSADWVGLSAEGRLLYLLLELELGAPEALPAKQQLNLCFVIDRSSSMAGERLVHVKQALKRVVRQLDPEDIFSLVVFNDRAQVVAPAQPVNQPILCDAIDRISASGGTELATGIACGLHQVTRNKRGNRSAHMIVLTDGNTYGDEQSCIMLARQAQKAGVGLSLLGVGADWNEDLFETMAAQSHGLCRYLTTAAQIDVAFSEEVAQLRTLAARAAWLQIDGCPGVAVRSIDQVRPFITPIGLAEPSAQRWTADCGDWSYGQLPAFLIELVIPPLLTGHQPIVKLALHYSDPADGTTARSIEQSACIDVRVAGQDPPFVAPQIMHALERLVAYRLQRSAWQDIAEGRLNQAAQRLQMVSQRLRDAGDEALARVTYTEATQLLSTGKIDVAARKRIRFTTRGLCDADGYCSGAPHAIRNDR